MALRFTTPIGTSLGILQNAYLRIDRYHLDKIQGKLDLHTSIYPNEDMANSASMVFFPHADKTLMHIPYSTIPKGESVQFPSVYSLMLTGSYVSSSFEYEPTGSIRYEEYQYLDSDNEIQTTNREVIETYTITSSIDTTICWVDCSSLSTGSIYEFAYPMIKSIIEETVGVGNVVDC